MRGLLALSFSLLSPTLFAQVRTAPRVTPAVGGLGFAPVGASAQALPGAPGALPGLPSLTTLPSLDAVSGAAPAPSGLRSAPSDRSRSGRGPIEEGPSAKEGLPESWQDSLRSLGQSEDPAAPKGPAEGSESSFGLSASVFDGAGKNGKNAAQIPGFETLASPLKGVKGDSTAPALRGPRLYPRVVFLSDVFEGKATDRMAQLIDTFQQKGVQVVLITQRPARGKGSIDEILTSKLAARRDNAVMIVSEGGGKIHVHSSRAKNPKSVIPDAGAFAAKDLPAAFGRIRMALEAVHHKDLMERPGEVLVLADAKRAKDLAQLLPQGSYVHSVKGEDALENALGAVLGPDGLDSVSVDRNKIRSYLEYVASKAPREYSGGGSYGGGRDQASAGMNRILAFYKGVIMYDLMSRLYRDMRNGQFHLATPDRAEARLKAMWRHPKKNFVRVPGEVARMMGTGAWQKFQGGALASAVGWLRNYYQRKLPDYPTGLMEGVVQTLANVASDGKSLITLEFRSPFTGRRYLVHSRPARAELHRGSDGPVLAAVSYRTGREKPGEQDDLEAKLLALAMLKGYASNDGSGWKVNGKPVSRVRVDFEYHTRTLSKTFDLAQLPDVELEVTSLIERMEADTAFIKKWEKERQEAKEAAAKYKKKAAKAKGGKA